MRWLVIAIAACAVIIAGCNPPDSNPKDVISLAVDTAPAPSIVAGDTMRIGDSTALGQLQAHAFNVKQDTLHVPILWLTLDPLVVTTDTFGHVFAGTDSVPSTPRIVAEAGGLQSLPFNISIVPRPDSLARDTTDTAQLIRGFCALPISTGFNATLFHVSSFAESTAVGVGSYLVHWAITSPASLVGTQTGSVPHIDSLVAYVSDLSGNPSLLDTTKSGGVSTRELIFGANAFDTTIVHPEDTLTVIVTATARYQGRQLHNPVNVKIRFVNPRKC
jgi:hypothetical protein